MTTTINATTAILSSPIQTVTGQYTGFEFHGPLTVLIVDQPLFIGGLEITAIDFWSIHSPTTAGGPLPTVPLGPEINGRSVVLFRLFSEIGNGAIIPISINPPVDPPYHLRVLVGFSDGTVAADVPVDSLVRVPEPSTLLLLFSGGLGALVWGSWRRRA